MKGKGHIKSKGKGRQVEFEEFDGRDKKQCLACGCACAIKHFFIMVMMRMLGLPMFVEKIGRGFHLLNPIMVVHFTSIHLHLS
jgi:hypothetical protein